MKNYIVTSLIIGFSFLQADAQTDAKKKSVTKFTSIIQAGILEGAADKSYGQFQLINGIQRNTWFYGLGLGIDYYGSKRSVPLFLDVKKDFKKRKNTPFVYADAGYNFSWLQDEDKIAVWANDHKESGGLYYETGLGYKFITKSNLAFGFSAGHSFKQQKEMGSQFIFIDFTPAGTGQLPDIYDYKFRRISLKFNCSF
jgi:hypothetical protein